MDAPNSTWQSGASRIACHLVHVRLPDTGPRSGLSAHARSRHFNDAVAADSVGIGTLRALDSTRTKLDHAAELAHLSSIRTGSVPLALGLRRPPGRQSTRSGAGTPAAHARHERTSTVLTSNKGFEEWSACSATR